MKWGEGWEAGKKSGRLIRCIGACRCEADIARLFDMLRDPISAPWSAIKEFVETCATFTDLASPVKLGSRFGHACHSCRLGCVSFHDISRSCILQ